MSRVSTGCLYLLPELASQLPLDETRKRSHAADHDTAQKRARSGGGDAEEEDEEEEAEEDEEDGDDYEHGYGSSDKRDPFFPLDLWVVYAKIITQNFGRIFFLSS